MSQGIIITLSKMVWCAPRRIKETGLCSPGSLICCPAVQGPVSFDQIQSFIFPGKCTLLISNMVQLLRRLAIRRHRGDFIALRHFAAAADCIVLPLTTFEPEETNTYGL